MEQRSEGIEEQTWRARERDGKSRDVIAGEERSCHEVGEEASRCLITSRRREAEEERRCHKVMICNLNEMLVFGMVGHVSCSQSSTYLGGILGVLRRREQTVSLYIKECFALS